MAPGTVRLHRVLRAKPEHVYKAFLDDDAMAKWLPPHGFTGKVHHRDANVGGTYKMSFTNFTTGNQQSFGGTYRELVLSEKIVYTDTRSHTGPDVLRGLARVVEPVGQAGRVRDSGLNFGLREAEPPSGAHLRSAFSEIISICAFSSSASACSRGSLAIGVALPRSLMMLDTSRQRPFFSRLRILRALPEKKSSLLASATPASVFLSTSLKIENARQARRVAKYLFH